MIEYYVSRLSFARSPTRVIVNSAVIRRRLKPRTVPPLSSISCYSTSSATTQGRDVRIVEVGPRDGLQNIMQVVPKEIKIELIQRLAGTGLRDIEATSFVSPKWVPQLADGHEVLQETLRFAHSQPGLAGLNFPVLAPNAKGLQNAEAAGANEIVVFASVTEAFSKANQNCTVDEAISQARAVTQEALALGIRVRGVISCVFSDPFSGPTAPEDVLRVVRQFLDMGCYEVGLGDTLGVGTPKSTQNLLDVLLREVPADRLAGHFHDTYGQGIANVYRAYEMGIRTFDSSIAGLGGCPYAPGARGNVATEDVVYTLEQSGIDTGVDLDKLVAAGLWISKQIGIPYGSRVGAALASKRSQPSASVSPTKVKKETAPVSRATRSWEVVHDTGEYRVSRSGTTMKITLTRPDNGNAMTDAMLEGLTDLFKNLDKDPLTYHVVLESEGKYFCTGMDLSGGTNTTDMSGDTNYYEKVAALFDAIDHVPQTTIALVDGPCFGGGVGLTFACDVRLVSPKARWTLSEVKIGVSPAVISKLLVREWGPSVAREAMLSGRQITPEQLWRIGAVHAITAEGELLDSKLDDYLNQLEAAAPRSAAVNKELSRLAWLEPGSRDQARLVEKAFHTMMADGGEGQFGIRQFRDKNKGFSWRKFWNGKNPFENPIYKRSSE